MCCPPDWESRISQVQQAQECSFPQRHHVVTRQSPGVLWASCCCHFSMLETTDHPAQLWGACATWRLRSVSRIVPAMIGARLFAESIRRNGRRQVLVLVWMSFARNVFGSLQSLPLLYRECAGHFAIHAGSERCVSSSRAIESAVIPAPPAPWISAPTNLVHVNSKIILDECQ